MGTEIRNRFGIAGGQPEKRLPSHHPPKNSRKKAGSITWPTNLTFSQEKGIFRKKLQFIISDLMRFGIKSSSSKHNGGNNIGWGCFFTR